MYRLRSRAPPLLRMHQLLVLALFVLGGSAYPSLYVQEFATSCTSHPTQGLGAHQDPQVDRDTTYTVSSGGQALTGSSFCAGKENSVEIAFPEARHALITASRGNFNESTDNKCPNRVVVGDAQLETPAVESKRVLLALKCENAPVTIKVTSASGPTAHYQASTVTLRPDASCAAAACAQNSSTNTTTPEAPSDEIPSNETEVPSPFGEGAEDNSTEGNSTEEGTSSPGNSAAPLMTSVVAILAVMLSIMSLGIV